MAVFTPDDGSTAFDSGSVTDVTLIAELIERSGAAQAAKVPFGFAGVDGSYEKSLGVRGVPYRWRIQLTATSKQAVRDMIETLDKLATASKSGTLTDTLGKARKGCVIQAVSEEHVPEPIGASIYRGTVVIDLLCRRPFE